MIKNGKRTITVTLTGEQWVALLARMLGKDLSDEGMLVYREACMSLKQQITEAGNGP